MFQGRPLEWQTYHLKRKIVSFRGASTLCVTNFRHSGSVAFRACSTVHLCSLQFSLSRASRCFKPTGCHKELDTLWLCQQLRPMRLQTCHSTLSWHQIYHWQMRKPCDSFVQWPCPRYTSHHLCWSCANCPGSVGFLCFHSGSFVTVDGRTFATWALNIEINETAGIIFLLKMLALGCIILANFVSFLNSIQEVQQVWSEWCLNLPITSCATGLPGFSFRSEDSTELCKFQPWNWHIKEFHVRLNEMFRCSKPCAFVPLCL